MSLENGLFQSVATVLMIYGCTWHERKPCLLDGTVTVDLDWETLVKILPGGGEPRDEGLIRIW